MACASFVHLRTAYRIEDETRALAARDAHDFGDEIRLFGRDHVLRALLFQRGGLVCCDGWQRWHRARPVRELNRREPHAARSRANDHVVTDSCVARSR